MFPLHLLSMDSQSKILGHDTLLVDQFNTRGFEVFTESEELGVVIEVGSVDETSGPCEDGSNGVGGGFVALLPFTVVSGDGTYFPST